MSRTYWTRSVEWSPQDVIVIFPEWQEVDLYLPDLNRHCLQGLGISPDAAPVLGHCVALCTSAPWKEIGR